MNDRSSAYLRYSRKVAIIIAIDIKSTVFKSTVFKSIIIKAIFAVNIDRLYLLKYDIARIIPGDYTLIAPRHEPALYTQSA